MLANTKQKLISYAQTLPASTERAQAYNIANLTAGESIAQAILDDHETLDGARRAARLLVDAGCATEKKENPKYFGIFTFEDGTSF
jgi:hypothetical protein